MNYFAMSMGQNMVKKRDCGCSECLMYHHNNDPLFFNMVIQLKVLILPKPIMRTREIKGSPISNGGKGWSYEPESLQVQRKEYPWCFHITIQRRVGDRP
jgi:hypothetical protein